MFDDSWATMMQWTTGSPAVCATQQLLWLAQLTQLVKGYNPRDAAARPAMIMQLSGLISTIAMYKKRHTNWAEGFVPSPEVDLAALLTFGIGLVFDLFTGDYVGAAQSVVSYADTEGGTKAAGSASEGAAVIANWW
jgi:hypothetical protein